MSARAFAVTVLALLAAPAVSADAAPTLESTSLTRSHGTVSFDPRVANDATVDGPRPFPNDAQNFASAGPDGLHFGVNLFGELSSSVTRTLPLLYVQTYRDFQFRVVFQVDEPSPFAYHRRIVREQDAALQPVLQADGQPPVALDPLHDTTGVLQPGRYTFSAETHEKGRLPFITPGEFGLVYGESLALDDVTLTVLPEPAALAALSLAALLLRRPRPRRHAGEQAGRSQSRSARRSRVG